MSLGVPSVTLFDDHSVGMDTSEAQYGIASTYSEKNGNVHKLFSVQLLFLIIFFLSLMLNCVL